MVVLEHLPLDILLNVLKYLAVKDILALRKTSKALYALTFERSVWFNTLYFQIVLPGYPVPHMGERSITSLSSSELEDITLGALRLHRSWNSAKPTPTRCTQLVPLPTDDKTRPRVLALFYLPGRGNRYLMSMSVEDQRAQPRHYNLDFWDLLASSQHRAARYHCTNLTSIAMNADPLHRCVIVVTTRIVDLDSDIQYTATVLGTDFRAQDLESRMQVLAAFPGVRHAIALKGSIFLSSQDFQNIRVSDVNTGTVQYILRVPLVHGDPTLQLNEFKSLNSLILDSFIVIFRQQWIHIYALPSVQVTSTSAEPQGRR